MVRIDQEACISCGTCVDACPYGQIYLEKETDKVFKCDLCDGEPKCVEACPHGVISLLKPGETRKYLGQDKLSHGVYMCQGCSPEAAFRFTQRVVDKVTGQPAVYFGTSSCMALVLMNAGVGRSYLGSSIYYCRMTNVASSMTGIRRHFAEQARMYHSSPSQEMAAPRISDFKIYPEQRKEGRKLSISVTIIKAI